MDGSPTTTTGRRARRAVPRPADPEREAAWRDGPRRVAVARSFPGLHQGRRHLARLRDDGSRNYLWSAYGRLEDLRGCSRPRSGPGGAANSSRTCVTQEHPTPPIRQLRNRVHPTLHSRDAQIALGPSASIGRDGRPSTDWCEDFLYVFKGGSLRSPPSAAAGGRKRPSSPVSTGPTETSP